MFLSDLYYLLRRPSHGLKIHQCVLFKTMRAIITDFMKLAQVEEHKPGVMRLLALRALHRKYGVVALVGITRSESGTASKSFGVRLSTSANSRMEATFPQR